MKKTVIISITVTLALSIILAGYYLLPPSKSNRLMPSDSADLNASSESSEIVIFAAASLTEALTEIKDLYETTYPDTTVTFNFDSSGNLKRQIEHGAHADIFFSASSQQMDALEARGDIIVNSRQSLLSNSLVLITRTDSDINMSDFSLMSSDEITLISIGNTDAPVGQYSHELIENLNLMGSIMSKITYSANPKIILSQVKSDSVDLGIVYYSDTINEDTVRILCHAPSDLHAPISYPIALLTTSRIPQEAQSFIDFLLTEEAIEVFIRHGFIVTAVSE